MEQSGQGAAFGQIGRTKLGVFTVLNALGVVVNREGQPVLGNFDRRSGLRSLVVEDLRRGKKPRPTGLAAGAGVSDNTALTLLVTNRQLRREGLQRMRGRYAHVDGTSDPAISHGNRREYFFRSRYGRGSTGDPNLSDRCVLSAELAWDAVLNCAPNPFAELQVRRRI